MTDLLVVDELLLDKSDAEPRSMPLELMESRRGTPSAVFCILFKKKSWRDLARDLGRHGRGRHAVAPQGNL